jgi:hypothetical protein
LSLECFLKIKQHITLRSIVAIIDIGHERCVQEETKGQCWGFVETEIFCKIKFTKPLDDNTSIVALFDSHNPCYNYTTCCNPK